MKPTERSTDAPATPKIRDLYTRFFDRLDERRPDRYSPDGPHLREDGRWVPSDSWLDDVGDEFEVEIAALSDRERTQLSRLIGRSDDR